MLLNSRSFLFFAALTLSSAAFCATHEDGIESSRIRKFENSLRPPVAVEGEAEQRWSLQERMIHWNVPGLSVAVIRDGKIAWAKGYGVLQVGRSERIDTQTVFSVGSVSKVATASIVLRMVDAGMLDLDQNVNNYLRSWKLSNGASRIRAGINPITLRGILSHTAGLSVAGFSDFLPGEALPSTLEILEGRAPAKNQPVLVNTVPGTMYRYSGGGTTVAQMIIEDVTSLGFSAAADKYLFAPLGMQRSTFENPIPEVHGNIAKAHDSDGKPRALPRGYEAMPEMAASGLWTTPSDYAKLVVALIESYNGKADSYIDGKLARNMMTEVAPSHHGLGPEVSGRGKSRRFKHDGANDSYRAYMEGHLYTGNGVVIFTNGENGYRLYTEVRRSIALVEGWGEEFNDHKTVKPISLMPEEFEKLVGSYTDLAEIPAANSGMRKRDVDGARVSVEYIGGSLYANGEHNRLIPLGPTHFVNERTGAEIEFILGYDGNIAAYVFDYGNGRYFEAKKISKSNLW